MSLAKYSIEKLGIGKENILIYGLLGILNITGNFYLGVITQTVNVNLNWNGEVFKIKEVMFLSFTYGLDYSKLGSEECAIIEGIIDLLTQGFYFSYHCDLTNTLQRNSKIHSGSSTLFDCANKHYVWNHIMGKKFEEDSTSTRWLTPIIQGFVKSMDAELSGKKLKVIIISRRRHKHAGTRFNARGIDDNGNVANMVETEQIVLYNGKTYSYVQVRGSVPVFWTQEGVLASISLTRSPEMAYAAFSKHFSELVRVYKRVLAFDLLSDKKSSEAKLINAYKANAEAYAKRSEANVKYVHFDFHYERNILVRAL